MDVWAAADSLAGSRRPAVSRTSLERTVGEGESPVDESELAPVCMYS